MLKRINKISRRLGKKKEKEKELTSSPSKSDVTDEKEKLSGKGSSMPNLRAQIGDANGDIGVKKSASGKSLDACNNETISSDYDTTDAIPVAASSEESLLDQGESDMWIPIEDLKSVYVTRHADEDRLFREEMKGISSYVSKRSPSCEYAKLPQNKEKNRYKNIVTFDKSRVILERQDNDPFSDYINASYIDGYTKKRKFIATQGPKPNTVNDFWRMIWEQKCTVVVMVTDFRESGKQKCEKYFPDDGPKQYGKLEVESGLVMSHGGYHQRTLTVRLVKDKQQDKEDDVMDDAEMKDEEEKREITHLQCKRWPDHGVPKTTSAIFRLYRKMNECQPTDSDAPILVHCSAGVGRTGTLIGLDILIDQLAAEKRVNIHDAVIEMRKNRTEMVQSMDQYVLLHKLILEHYYLGNTDLSVAEFEKNLTRLDQIDDDTGVAGFESEFELLSIVPPQNARLGSGNLSHNASKNKDEKIIPYEHSPVFIRMRPTEMRPPYVNASTLLGYDDTIRLVAAQDPLPNLLEDFWRVIIDNSVTCIVMLTPETKDDDGYCPRYWPSDDVMEFGDITINFEESVDHGEYCETKLTILTDDREKLGRPITHLHFKKWAEDDPPPAQADSTVLEIVAQVAKHKRTEDVKSNNKVLVHCRDGAGHTGAFCAIVNIVQRLKCENRVDVFRAIKDLRDCRPGMVKTADEYRFCHQTVATYLRSFDLYSNGR